MKALPHMFWRTPSRWQGQIVAWHYPQVSGKAEGAQGPARGLSLRTDAVEGDWSLWIKGKAIARERGNAPSVSEAVALAAASRARTAS